MMKSMKSLKIQMDKLIVVVHLYNENPGFSQIIDLNKVPTKYKNILEVAITNNDSIELPHDIMQREILNAGIEIKEYKFPINIHGVVDIFEK